LERRVHVYASIAEMSVDRLVEIVVSVSLVCCCCSTPVRSISSVVN
jgi:hypothetical protein